MEPHGCENTSNRKRSFVSRFGNNFGTWFSGIFGSSLNSRFENSKDTTSHNFYENQQSISQDILNSNKNNQYLENQSNNLRNNFSENFADSRNFEPPLNNQPYHKSLNNGTNNVKLPRSSNQNLNSSYECSSPIRFTGFPTPQFHTPQPLQLLNSRKRSLDNTYNTVNSSSVSTARRIMDQLEALNTAPLRNNIINFASTASTADRRRQLCHRRSFATHDDRLSCGLNNSSHNLTIRTGFQPSPFSFSNGVGLTSVSWRGSPSPSSTTVDLDENNQQQNERVVDPYLDDKAGEENGPTSKRSRYRDSATETVSTRDACEQTGSHLLASQLTDSSSSQSKRSRVNESPPFKKDGIEAQALWICINCGLNNHAMYRYCRSCHTRKDPVTGLISDCGLTSRDLISVKSDVGPSKSTIRENTLGEISKKWRCRNCYIWNSNGDSRCQTCATANSEAVANKPDSPINNTTTTTSKNIAFTQSSLIPPIISQADVWNCPTCCVQVQVSKDTCPCCETVRNSSSSTSVPQTSASSLLAAIQQNAASKWTCDTCCVQNDSSVDKCVACECVRVNCSSTAGNPPLSIKFGSEISASCQPLQSTTTTTSAAFTAPLFSFGQSSQSSAGSGFSAPFNFSLAGPPLTSSSSLSSLSAPAPPANVFQFGVASTSSITSTTAISQPLFSAATSLPTTGGIFQFGAANQQPARSAEPFKFTAPTAATGAYIFGQPANNSCSSIGTSLPSQELNNNVFKLPNVDSRPASGNSSGLFTFGAAAATTNPASGGVQPASLGPTMFPSLMGANQTAVGLMGANQTAVGLMGANQNAVGLMGLPSSNVFDVTGGNPATNRPRKSAIRRKK